MRIAFGLLGSQSLRVLLGYLPLLMASVFSACQTLRGDDDQGSGVKTEIKKVEIGKPLTGEDQHQLSLLGGQLLGKIQQSRISIDGNNADQALNSVRKALQLTRVIRSILPKAQVTTKVVDKAGTVLYEDDQIDTAERFVVYHMLTEVDKSNWLEGDESSKGMRFEGSKLIDMDVLLDIGYVERRLKEAEEALPAEPEKAFFALSDAQKKGTELMVEEFESPLHDAQEAVRYALEAAERKEYKAAQSNLKIAREYLGMYRDLVSPGQHEEIDKLSAEISKATSEVANSASHDRTVNATKSFMDRIKKWTSKAVRSGKPVTEDTKPSP